jgi:hypothetical protein
MTLKLRQTFTFSQTGVRCTRLASPVQVLLPLILFTLVQGCGSPPMEPTLADSSLFRRGAFAWMGISVSASLSHVCPLPTERLPAIEADRLATHIEVYTAEILDAYVDQSCCASHGRCCAETATSLCEGRPSFQGSYTLATYGYGDVLDPGILSILDTEEHFALDVKVSSLSERLNAVRCSAIAGDVFSAHLVDECGAPDLVFFPTNMDYRTLSDSGEFSHVRLDPRSGTPQVLFRGNTADWDRAFAAD